MRADAFIRFPAPAFRSHEEFLRFREKSGDLLDERYRRERALGSKERAITLEGTCGLCLQVTRFESQTAGGEATPDGRLVPNWREQQVCGCGRNLNCRQRALLHFALAKLGMAPWVRAAVLGRDDGVVRYLSAVLPNLVVWPQIERVKGGSAFELPADSGAFHMVLCADHLQHVPALDMALTEAARVLSPGGSFAFTVPFYFDAKATKSDTAAFSGPNGTLPAFLADPAHQIGWDIADRIFAAGFTDFAAYCYWSEELGYLGPYNMIFLASR